MNNYNEKLQKLTNQVDQITSTDGGGFKKLLPNINYKLIGIISIPIIIILFLIFSKSSLIMSDKKDKKDKKKKINYVKLFIILGILIGGEVAFYFFYLRKKSNNVDIMT